jgi:hypothetical protein
LAEKWFAEHLEKSETGGNGAPVDKNAELIVETLNQLLANNKLRIPRGGYHVTRGRGRVIVSRVEAELIWHRAGSLMRSM